MPAALFVEAIGLENRHGAADGRHRGIESLNVGRQELVPEAQLVHHIPHHGGEQLAASHRE